MEATQEAQEAHGQATQEAQEAHELYERLGFIVISAAMSATKPKSKGGEWKKRFAFPREWQQKTSKVYDKGATGFALVTGRKSGTTAIDVDDPETAQNKKLMALMANCNLVARTKRGFHFVYGYEARILAAARRAGTSWTRGTTGGASSLRRAWRTTTRNARWRRTSG
jgi:hypothetical protein